MSRLQFQRAASWQAPITSLRPWAPSLALWGVGAGTAALFILSVTPLVKRELLVKVPLIGSYYEDKIPDSDKPF
ncbi:hypothetical protein FIBSPDRAFT_785737 [Athelia psychrophila]|uniref:Uncharacterized protein n=1 Tax=Athelia psychrophila TaxID=1759441 RepID=A0A166M431_9AGAM|nr:hypothetical protein FIBSPDRAFT_785737 [Fibularhizoctonia sp. CBS 109695]